MKKFLALFLLLTSCQGTNYEYSSGTSLYLDGSASECLEKTCENLGKMRLDGTAGVTAELQPLTEGNLDEITIVFKDNDSDLQIPKYEADSLINAVTGWFELRIYFLDKENIYVWNLSGDEFIPGTLSFYNGTEWRDLDLEGNVRNALPEESRSEELDVRDVLISRDKISVTATVGDDIQYLELVNYVMNFDAATMELLDFNEITKPL